MDYVLFFMIGVPVFSSILCGGIIGTLIYNKLDNNEEFRKKWSGWGGSEFWSDAKKINDTQLQKYIYFFEMVCPKLFIVGFIITVIFALIFFYFYG